MAITAVMVDRARLLSKEEAGRKVEGTTQMADVVGPWFRARLFLPSAGEQDGPSGNGTGRKKTVPRPQLMWALRDSEGGDVEIHFDQKVEVDSTELGRAIWKVNGEPEKIRKKRRVIGHLADLERTSEREFETV
jgi:hypothetical protein